MGERRLALYLHRPGEVLARCTRQQIRLELQLGRLRRVRRKCWRADDVVWSRRGAALRLRGGGDAFDSTLLAETRLFVRLMAPRDRTSFAERSTDQPMTERAPITLLVGLGAVWGSGERRYADKLRSRFATPILFPGDAP